MDMINVQTAAEKWGVTPRFVQMLCKEGRILGATRWGRAWMIPADAPRPGNEQNTVTSAATDPDPDMPLPRKTPFLYMTNLYHAPGVADESVTLLQENPEAQMLYTAQLAYARGEIDAVYDHAGYLLSKHSGFYAVQSAGMLLGLCSIWHGDVEMWKKAKMHICEAPCRNDTDRDIMTLSLTALDSLIYDTRFFPEWFKTGNFEPLHPDALPAAKVFYAKYLNSVGYDVASNQHEIRGVQGRSILSLIPYAIEPMISQAIVDQTVIVELYLRLLCAEVYHHSENDAQAIRHLDAAIALALPDRLFGVLAEFRRSLGTLLDDRLEKLAPDALPRVLELFKMYSVGWATLSGFVRNRRIETSFSLREREVAKLAAFGLSNADIAAKLHLSLASVKQSIRIAIYKGGVNTRDELALIL